MGLLQSIANLEMDYYDAIAQRKRDRELKFADQDRAIKAQQANEALQNVIALEQQRQQAENPQIPLRPQTFERPEELQLYQAYGQAGLDPQKMAEAQTAQLAAEAFAQAIPNVTSDVGRINIGLGKEYRPDVYRQDEIKANDANIRLNTIRSLLNREDIDPLLSADLAQNKSVFDSQEVEIEGKNGKRHKAFANLTPSGNYIHATVKDREGKPLVIPPESGKPTADMLNTKYYAQLWGMTEADTSKILKSRSTDTPAESWAKIVNANSKNQFGNNVKPYDMLKNSLMVWNTARQGQALPVDIDKAVTTYGLNESQTSELLDIAGQINENARQVELSKTVEDEAKSGKPSTGIPALSAMPGFGASQQQAQPETPFYQMPGVAGIAPAATQPVPIPEPLPEPLPESAPELQPLTPVAIHTAWTEIQKGEKPDKVRKALTKQGFDLSPESVDQMAIEAINLNVPAEVLQQYLKTIGIEWQPT